MRALGAPSCRLPEPVRAARALPRLRALIFAHFRNPAATTRGPPFAYSYSRYPAQA